METRIPFKPKSLFLFLITVCFGLCALVTGYVALNDTNGINLFNLVTLNPTHATIVYFVLSGLSLVGMTAALVLFFLTVSQKREIIFTENELQFPHLGLGRDYIHIPYNDIVQTSEVQVNNTNIFNVDHQRGEISLRSSMVPGKQYYEQFKSEISHRVYGDVGQGPRL